MRVRILAAAAAVATSVAVACKSDDKPATSVTAPASTIVTFKAAMAGAGEIPTNTSPGSGAFTATLDTATNVFTYDITFSGLTSPVNNGHIHGPAFATANAGTTINFNTLPGATFSFGQTSGTAHGSAVLTSATQITATINGDSLKKLLFAGMTYANIHTTQNPGGEIRGQIVRQ
jgi:hypothetical protein